MYVMGILYLENGLYIKRGSFLAPVIPLNVP